MTRDRQATQGWDEQRVERLLQELFGTTPVDAGSRAHRRWTPWVSVAACALMLLALVPAFSVPNPPATTADGKDEHELVAVAEVAVAEDRGDLESATAEAAGDEESEPETTTEAGESS